MTAASGPRLHRTTFRTSRLLDFASEKELTAQTGHDRKMWPLVIVKELVDNAIDACEEVNTSPTIEVRVDSDGVTVTDNGPGLPPDTVESILDFTVRVSSREAYVSPTRGAQGNALKTILAMPFVLDGEHGTVAIEARGIRHVINFAVDRIKQEPILDHVTEPLDEKIGTTVRVHWPDSARSILDDVRERFLQIVVDYAWLNPHLTIAVDWFGDRPDMVATDPAWTKWKPSDPTSPHWYSGEHIERLIAGYLRDDAGHNRKRTLREFVGEFRGLSGSTKSKAVLDAIGLTREPLSRLVNGNELDHELVDRLLDAMKEHSRPVKPAALGVIGIEHFKKRFANVGCEMQSFDYRKVVDTTDDIPWVIETAFGWCPDADQRRLITGVNWSPGIINPFRQLGHFGESLDTILNEQRAKRHDPVTLVLHMSCPRVEYTDRGKSAIVVKR